MTDKPPAQRRGASSALQNERRAPGKASLFEYLAGPMDAARVVAAMDMTQPAGPAIIPRHIWMYWHDGWDDAPEVAKLCLQSWMERNPGYEVHALDYRTLCDFLSDPPVHYEKTKLNSFANRVRLRLLRTRGGVWADATNFCVRPIDLWIDERTSPARFFAYALPGADRPIATWFLAAAPQSAIVAVWEELVALYIQHIERERRQVHAYFFMPYILEFALSHSLALQTLWDTMPRESVKGAAIVSGLARLQKADETSEIPDTAREKIAAVLTESEMQKLTWKAGMLAQTLPARQLLDMLRLNLRDHHPEIQR